MATTKIWSRKGSLLTVLLYAANPEKTKPKEYNELTDASPDKVYTDELTNLLTYAGDSGKTKSGDTYYVSGVLCSAGSVYEEMMAVKRKYKKTDGIIAHHAYQSFSPGEVVAETAHEIGVKLAEQMWGDKYQVLVTTHLDKGHIHNHFVLNSVSIVDGSKYNGCRANYKKFRDISDSLCAEYGLSVIPYPDQAKKSKHQGEIRAEAEGRPTLRQLVKADVDEFIKTSKSIDDFYLKLRTAGYEIKPGKDITLRPRGSERGIRIGRSFGLDYYSEDAIKKRIYKASQYKSVSADTSPKYKSEFRGRSVLRRRRRRPRFIKGIRADYMRTLYRLGYMPKRKVNYARLNASDKSALTNLGRLAADAMYLRQHRIEDISSLVKVKDDAETRIKVLVAERLELRNKKRRSRNAVSIERLKTEIADKTKQIKAVSDEIKSCERIQDRSSAGRVKSEEVNTKEAAIRRRDKEAENGRGS